MPCITKVERQKPKALNQNQSTLSVTFSPVTYLVRRLLLRLRHGSTRPNPSVESPQNLRLRCLFSRCRFPFFTSLALLFHARVFSPRFSQKNVANSLCWRCAPAVFDGVVSGPACMAIPSSPSSPSSDSAAVPARLPQELNRLGAAVSGVGAALRSFLELSSCELKGVSGIDVVASRSGSGSKKLNDVWSSRLGFAMSADAAL